jgi:hypothetical protein
MGFEALSLRRVGSAVAVVAVIALELTSEGMRFES